MNRILCGLPMSGKTTIGKMLADRLQLNFVDTDKRLEQAYAEKAGSACSCRQIFLEHGEAYFREFEKRQIDRLKNEKAAIIALGGGALNNRANGKVLRTIGRIIYLKAPVEILWQRILKRGVPLYLDPLDPERSFYALADRRLPLYEQAAHAVIETEDLSEEAVVEAIINMKEIKNGK